MKQLWCVSLTSVDLLHISHLKVRISLNITFDFYDFHIWCYFMFLNLLIFQTYHCKYHIWFLWFSYVRLFCVSSHSSSFQYIYCTHCIWLYVFLHRSSLFKQILISYFEAKPFLKAHQGHTPMLTTSFINFDCLFLWRRMVHNSLNVKSLISVTEPETLGKMANLKAKSKMVKSKMAKSQGL